MFVYCSNRQGPQPVIELKSIAFLSQTCFLKCEEKMKSQSTTTTVNLLAVFNREYYYLDFLPSV